MTNELQLSDDLTQITAEIKSYQAVGGQAIIEIGRRLNWVKEHDLSHGQWGDWLKQVSFNQSTANKFMKIAREFSESESVPNLGWAALYEVATTPAIDREALLTDESGEPKSADDLTVQKLHEAKMAIREKDVVITNLFAVNQQLKARAPKTVEKRVEVAPADYDEVKNDNARMQQTLDYLKKRNDNLETELQELQDDSKGYATDSAEYEQLKQRIATLRGQQSKLERKGSAAAHLIDFKGHTDDWLNELAPELFATDFAEFAADDPAMKTVRSVITKVRRWADELESLLPDKNVIEVNDYDE